MHFKQLSLGFASGTLPSRQKPLSQPESQEESLSLGTSLILVCREGHGLSVKPRAQGASSDPMLDSDSVLWTEGIPSPGPPTLPYLYHVLSE